MKITRLLFFASFIFLYSCEGLFNSAPTVTYSETNLSASFFEEGNSPAPTVNWGGTQGSFEITQNIEGLSVNSTNGIVSWTAILSPGMHEFDVLASNSSGQVSVPMTIDNAFEGTFTGTYSGSSFFELEFSADGTLIIRANSETEPDTGSGTWILEDDVVTANYTYDEVGDEYSISANLTQTASEAALNGNWYVGHDNTDGSPGGTVEVILQ